MNWMIDNELLSFTWLHSLTFLTFPSLPSSLASIYRHLTAWLAQKAHQTQQPEVRPWEHWESMLSPSVDSRLREIWVELGAGAETIWCKLLFGRVQDCVHAKISSHSCCTAEYSRKSLLFTTQNVTTAAHILRLDRQCRDGIDTQYGRGGLFLLVNKRNYYYQRTTAVLK
jgi:hypothetical protein